VGGGVGGGGGGGGGQVGMSDESFGQTTYHWSCSQNH